MKNNKIVIVFLVTLIASLYTEQLKVTPLEQFNIPIAFGNDIDKDLDGNVQYNILYSIYDIRKKEIGNSGVTIKNATTSGDVSSSILEGKSSSLGGTREERQLNSSKPFLIGIEKIVLLSEEQANYGILDIINIFFANAKINDRGVFAVCKGRAEDILRLKVEGYPSSADFMQGMIHSATNYNFISAKYTLMNIYITLASEGENLVLPYIEIKNEKVAFTGMALFKGNKMAYALPMEESKIMNILREKNGKGILSLQDGPDKYINYDAMVKRKVKCNKRDGKYEFTIDLDFQGEIKENTLYKDLKKENDREFEKLMGKKIERMCNDFLDKMKNSYKLDCLNLGMYAAAKYGRETGVDWNKEVSNANIKVNVNVKIDMMGRGQY